VGETESSCVAAAAAVRVCAVPPTLRGAALHAGYRAQVRGDSGRRLARQGASELRPVGTAFRVA
jgi:hypothetical protein